MVYAQTIEYLDSTSKKNTSKPNLFIHFTYPLIESVRPVTPSAALNNRSVQKQLLKAKFYDRASDKVIYSTPKSIDDLK